VSATEPAADMSASAKPASMSPAEAATMSATTAAARKRISGQSGGESDSRREDDHRLT
jgi:hypothetical protein